MIRADHVPPRGRQSLPERTRQLEESLPEHVEGEVLVRLKSGLTGAGDLLTDYGAEVMKRYRLPGQAALHGGAPEILRVHLAEGQSTAEGIARLETDPRILYAVSNDILHELDTAPNDLHEKLWGLDNQGQTGGTPGADISARAAWDITTGSRNGPVVAVIDGGTDYTHPDLAANIWTNPGEVPGNGIDDDGNGVIDDVHGFDSAANDGDPMDDGSHGTHTAGTVAAVGDNGQGVVGVNWQAQVMPIKFLAGGFGDTADAIEGLLYATNMGARITSNSWGGSVYNQALCDTLAASPALHICAAGNDSANNDIGAAYPASYPLPNIVAVAATDSNDQLASFSNYGVETVHLAAPGVNTWSTIPNGQYGSKSGTSMATPHVSGVATLIATEYPELTNQQIKDRLLFGADRLPQLQDKLISGGRLNAARSLEDDTRAPGSVGLICIDPARVTTVSVPLAWQATGDDCCEGTAAAYEVRYSPNPITADNFTRAQELRVGPPRPAGEREEATLALRPSGQPRTLYVAVRAVDNVGNRGPLSTTSVQVPAATVAFEDDGEQGAANWTAEGTWGLVDYPGRGQVWADSPQGEYHNGDAASLTSRSFSLEGLKSAHLHFDCKHDLEINFDKVFLEVSQNGQDWVGLDSYNLKTGWETKHYDLTPYVGGPLQVRFRIKTDQDVTKDGFYLDNLVVTGERAEGEQR